jgi:hypothetical protein
VIDRIRALIYHSEHITRRDADNPFQI